MCLAQLRAGALSVMKWKEFHFWVLGLCVQRILEATLSVNAQRHLEAQLLSDSQGLNCLHSIINLSASRENNRKTFISLLNQEVFLAAQWLVDQTLFQISSFAPPTWLPALRTSSISQQETQPLTCRHLRQTQPWL